MYRKDGSFFIKLNFSGKIDNLDGLKYDNLESKIDRLEIILNDIVNNFEKRFENFELVLEDIDDKLIDMRD